MILMVIGDIHVEYFEYKHRQMLCITKARFCIKQNRAFKAIVTCLLSFAFCTMQRVVLIVMKVMLTRVWYERINTMLSWIIIFLILPSIYDKMHL